MNKIEIVARCSARRAHMSHHRDFVFCELAALDVVIVDERRLEESQPTHL